MFRRESARIFEPSGEPEPSTGIIGKPWA
jgi:hypothetical protein